MYNLLLIFLVLSQELYNEAKKSYDTGDFELASKKFEQFLIKYPQDNLTPLALYYAAKLRKKPEEAINYYKKLISKYPKSKVASDALHNIAQYHYALGEYQEMLEIYEKILSTYPSSNSAESANKYIEKIKSFVFIQVGYFSSQENAYRLAEKLKEFHPRIIKDQQHYRVWIGPCSSPEEAKNLMLQKGLKGILKKIK